MGDGACLWSDELKISQPVQHTAIRPNKKKNYIIDIFIISTKLKKNVGIMPSSQKQSELHGFTI
jgi:galactitol-specific phosphotransferase system IIB component